MRPIFKHVPPRNSPSTHAVLNPNCAARIAAVYPPGPAPITIKSKFVSATIFSNSGNGFQGGEEYGGRCRWSRDPASAPAGAKDSSPGRKTGGDGARINSAPAGA